MQRILARGRAWMREAQCRHAGSGDTMAGGRRRRDGRGEGAGEAVVCAIARAESWGLAAAANGLGGPGCEEAGNGETCVSPRAPVRAPCRAGRTDTRTAGPARDEFRVRVCVRVSAAARRRTVGGQTKSMSLPRSDGDVRGWLWGDLSCVGYTVRHRRTRSAPPRRRSKQAIATCKGNGIQTYDRGERSIAPLARPARPSRPCAPSAPQSASGSASSPSPSPASSSLPLRARLPAHPATSLPVS